MQSPDEAQKQCGYGIHSLRAVLEEIHRAQGAVGTHSHQRNVTYQLTCNDPVAAGSHVPSITRKQKPHLVRQKPFTTW